MEKQTIFEVLGFIPDPEKETVFSTLIKLICKDDSVEGSKLFVNMHDAAILAAYFGVPKNEQEKSLWESLSFSEKMTKILNVFSDGGFTSFAKIM